jgi:hypothetical protein
MFQHEGITGIYKGLAARFSNKLGFASVVVPNVAQ